MAKRWHAVVGVIFLVGLCGVAPALAPSAGAEARSVNVAISPLTPFVIKSSDRWTGFTVELWEEIAERLGWSTNYLQVDGIQGQLKSRAEVIDRHARPAQFPGAAGLKVHVGVVVRRGDRGAGPGAHHVAHRTPHGLLYRLHSDLRKPVDGALLAIREDGTYDTIATKWFGPDEQVSSSGG